MDKRDAEIEAIKEELLENIKSGMVTNFQINKIQNKYLKQLLLYAIMRASKNDRVAPKNFAKLINKIFKKFIIRIIKISLPDDYDEEFYEENLLVELNKILASQQLLDSSNFIEDISPANVLSIIRKEAENMSAQDIVNKVLALRDLKSNHRETPEEEKERKERARQRELTRMRELQNERVLSRGSRTRS